MRALSRLVPVALASMLGGTAACGGDSTGPKNASSVTGVAGDNQSGSPGAQLEFPLSMVLLASNGTPASGVSVAWSVTTGTATLNPTKSTSDANGYTATNVTLGGGFGSIVVRATVPGVSTPVDYHINAVDPCTVFVSHTIGTTVQGNLTTNDCNLGGWYYDLFSVTVPSQMGAAFDMSATYDTWLDLFRVSNDTLYYVAFNNNVAAGSTNSEINAFLAPGTYVIGANTNVKAVTGPYTFTSANRAQTIENCEVVWGTRGITISGTLATTDCQPSVIPTNDTYSDIMEVIGDAGTSFTLKESSSTINPKLSLYRIDQTGLTSVAANDDSSAGNPTAFIQYTSTVDAAYVIFIGAGMGETGAYTFSISPSTTIPAPPVAAVAAQPQQLNGRHLVTRRLPRP